MSEDIEGLKAEIRAIGQYWRNDWSEFDGRTLKYQINRAIENYEQGKELMYFRNMLAESEDKS